jgi:hypothetical protein
MHEIKESVTSADRFCARMCGERVKCHETCAGILGEEGAVKPATWGCFDDGAMIAVGDWRLGWWPGK